MPRSLVTIENGTLADATVVNANFTYLDDRITANGSSITTLQSSIQSVNTNLNAEINSVEGSKADIDGSNMASSVKNFDGQWVQSSLSISTATSIASREHDLSSYLPNDDYSYEVMFNISGSTVDSSDGGTCTLDLGTVASPYSNNCFKGRIRVSKNSTQSYNFIILPINSNKKVYSQITGHKFNNAYIDAVGYRRIGTNS